ncbi:MAG TPA: hypothetical protein DCQ06_09490, partial [Myxococcales bacterium]|nr:hypothetical protein [Myxococcales bacterium]
YTFDDFLLSRYHMLLMVYFHHKVECFDQMLKRYYEQTPDFVVPADPEGFLQFDDPAVFYRLRKDAAHSTWARDIVEARPLEVVAERGWHGRFDDLDELEVRLHDAGVPFVRTGSASALSKYRGKTSPEREIYVRIRPRFGEDRFQSLAEATKLFDRYDETTYMERTYVRADDALKVGDWVDKRRQNPQLTLQMDKAP